MNAPLMYGKFHLSFLAAVAVTAPLAAWSLRRTSDERRAQTVFSLSCLMLMTEAFKQVYLTVVINSGHYDWFHFPFQLCSAAMYAGVMVKSRKYRKTAETFLYAWELPAAFFALIYPQDMLSSDLFLLLHSFIYHGLMVFIAFWIAFSEKMEWKNYVQALLLFLLLSVMAELLNAIGMMCGGNPDFFYINPRETCRQPFFGMLAEHLGRGIEIVIYLVMIAAMAAGVFWVYRFLCKNRISGTEY